jgi:ribosomal protein L28
MIGGVLKRVRLCTKCLRMLKKQMVKKEVVSSQVESAATASYF